MTSCTCRAERERGQREVLQIYFSHGSSPTSVISNGVTRACPSLLVPEKYTRGGVAVRNNKKNNRKQPVQEPTRRRPSAGDLRGKLRRSLIRPAV